MQRAPIRVLVVEDDQDTLDTLATYLSASLRGVVVERASSATAALLAIDAQRPQIVVADYLLPDADGLAVLQHAHRCGAATIMITAYPELEVALQALRTAHVVRFFTKPPNPELLIRSLQEVVEVIQCKQAWQTAFQRAMDAGT